MDIQTIYTRLNRLDLVTSHAEFSRVWLGRSSRYYSKLLTTDRQPGVSTLNALCVRLAVLVASMRASPRRQELWEFVEDLRQHVDRRSIVDIRRRKPAHLLD